jgi:two-component system response regulator ArlR
LGLKAVEECKPDLVLLDILLPGINGMEVCRRIRQFSEVPVIMLTARDATMDKVMGLDLGASDYITKPFAIEELLARVRAALRKGSAAVRQNSNPSIGNLVIEVNSRQVIRGSDTIDLTKREYDLLEYLVRNKGIVISRENIIEKVWGYDYMGDTNVVDVYVRYLRSKVDEPYDVKLIHTVRGVGYIMKEEKVENLPG